VAIGLWAIVGRPVMPAPQFGSYGGSGNFNGGPIAPQKKAIAAVDPGTGAWIYE